MPVLLPLCVAFILLSPSLGNFYLHSPRGSNNRLNEKSAERNNASRLFDSQNNNRGGYNAGDKTDQAFKNEEGIYYEKFFMSAADARDGPNGGQSILRVEWTNQHGCGGSEDSDPHKLNCNLVMQFMCQDRDESYSTNAMLSANLDTIRNGRDTNSQNYRQPNSVDVQTRNPARSVNGNRGLHERFEYYDRCYGRERNQGLFLADQNLERSNGFDYSSAIYTRQNPNGNRYGYECPEERDYYPYWHPNPWKDIAVFVQNISLCDFYTSESHNVVPRGECHEGSKPLSRWNNQAQCEANGGTWFEQWSYLEVDGSHNNQAACEGDSSGGFRRKWARQSYEAAGESCLVLPPAPQCLQAPWSRVNHLGNGRDGVALNYDWVLPHFPSGDTQRCVFRMRYNISTDDYDPWNTDYRQNNNRQTGVISPVTQNPYVDIGSSTNKPLRLAINTAQFGRTFQDRTHVFILRPRSLLQEADRNARIYNLNVRGKRGNIVQTYPAVEYDFVPKRLTIQADDLVHFQWTGSNTHNNGKPAGDGQTGDAGEGTSGTDRNNIVPTLNETVNYPLPWEHPANMMFKVASTRWIPTGLDSPRPEELAVYFASSGYFHCVRNDRCGRESVQTKNALNNLLNNAPASFEGAVLRFPRGTYHYICSRNNNFTNRSQKGRLVVQ